MVLNKLNLVTLILIGSLYLLQIHAQGFQVGYNVAHYHQGFKSLQEEQFKFNKFATTLITPFEYSPLMKGIEFGFSETEKAFSFNLSYRRHALKIVADRMDQINRPDYREIKLINNTFLIGINVGGEKAKIGYEIELGILKRLDKVANGTKWDRFRDKSFAPSFNLVAQFSQPIKNDKLAIIIKPYWRLSGKILKLFERQRQLYEYYNLQSIGVSVLLNINPS